MSERSTPAYILSVNRGSSSLKFALFQAAGGAALQRLLTGKIDRIGGSDMKLDAQRFDAAGQGGEKLSQTFEQTPNAEPAGLLLDFLDKHVGVANIVGVGHRIVHGGPKYWEAQAVTAAIEDELKRLSPFDPEHLPVAYALLKAMERRFPTLLQVVCFDTAFHHNMPRVAQILPIPRQYFEKGIRRYGFHGLSYSFLMEELARIAGPEAAAGRIVIAHLGSGASLAAIRDGRSIDTSMSFTPTAGIPMGTRTGDLDPGLAAYLVHTENMTLDQFHDMINARSGMLGVSETSSDMRDLLDREASDPRAADAVAMFCYQAKKWIGAFAAALGGIDTLVFSGGIGEHAPPVRERICDGLRFLGIDIDQSANQANDAVISTGRVTVRVMTTDEELMIARSVRKIVGD